MSGNLLDRIVGPTTQTIESNKALAKFLGLNSKLEDIMTGHAHIERVGWLVDRLYHELNEQEA
jgi:hypothetical protein